MLSVLPLASHGRDVSILIDRQGSGEEVEVEQVEVEAEANVVRYL